MRCIHCSTEVTPGAGFCAGCGRPTAEGDADRCRECGATLEASDIFCGHCGRVRDDLTTRSALRTEDTIRIDPSLLRSHRPAPTVRSAGLPATEPARPSRVAPRPVALEHPEPPPPLQAPPLSPERIRLPTVPRDRNAATQHTGAAGRQAPRTPPSGEDFVLQFSTGESVTVRGSGLIGRNPLPDDGELVDSLVAIVDPGRSVSKTHLQFGQEAGVFWVLDRESGNGSTVRQPGTVAQPCESGYRYRVARGSRVDIGEQFFVVS